MIGRHNPLDIFDLAQACHYNIHEFLGSIALGQLHKFVELGEIFECDFLLSPPMIDNQAVVVLSFSVDCYQNPSQATYWPRILSALV